MFPSPAINNSRNRLSRDSISLHQLLTTYVMSIFSYVNYIRGCQYSSPFARRQTWSKNSLSYRPTGIDATNNRCMTDASDFTPSCQTQNLTFNSNQMIIPFVIILLFARSPAAILWFIITRIINAFQSHVLWAWSHILKKCWEVIYPFGTHRNSTATIISIVSISRIIASSLRTGPLNIFATSIFASAGIPMFHNLLVYHDLYEK